MQSVIRNGQYIVTEDLLFGDMQVPEKPHEYAVFTDGTWVIDVDAFFEGSNSAEAMEFLNSTDWKVIRHRDQLALGAETSLNENEYLELLQKRQQAREEVIND